MGNTYTQIHIHVVFAVKYREALISADWKERLYRYMATIINNHGHKTLAIGGTSNHVHLFFGFRPTQSLSSLIMIVKRETSEWINNERFTRSRFQWQGGYGAFSYSKSHVKRVIRYILNQESHHTKKTFREEYLEMLKKNEIRFDERYMLLDT